jgi:hypothetical protein
MSRSGAILTDRSDTRSPESPNELRQHRYFGSRRQVVAAVADGHVYRFIDDDLLGGHRCK